MVTIVGLLDDFAPPFVTLPPLVAAAWLIWVGSVVPWLTFRGLPADCLEVFSADHGLTSRGLPAEGLGALPHEAASSSNLPEDADRVP